jgi:hypothetical protein
MHSSSFVIPTFTHSLNAVRRSDWTGLKGRRELVASYLDLGRAAVLASVAACPTEDTLRIEGELRAGQVKAAFPNVSGRGPVLDRTVVSVLRDFHRSSRAGDFGQALGYLVCQRMLGLNYVVDYEQFSSIVGRPSIGTLRRPDYVAFSSPEDSFFAIVECKGRFYLDPAESTLATRRSVLKEAHKQAMVGFEHLATRARSHPRGINKVISILALGHGTGRTGMMAHVMQDSRAVEPWDLRASQRVALRRLAYGMWGTMAGGVLLGKTLKEGLCQISNLQGRSYEIGGSAYWVPRIELQSKVHPFAISNLLGSDNVHKMTDASHGIRREALLAYCTGSSDSITTEFRVGPLNHNNRIIASEYGDGTAIIDCQNAGPHESKTLEAFVEG